MNRVEFMTELASLLQDVPVEERREAMRYYNDYFDEAGKENEAQAISDLGSLPGWRRRSRKILEGRSRKLLPGRRISGQKEVRRGLSPRERPGRIQPLPVLRKVRS